MFPKLQDLPEECIREIILRIDDHRDLEASSAAWTLMSALASEQRVWRELTQFHFTKYQIDQIVQKQSNNIINLHTSIGNSNSDSAKVTSHQINDSTNKISTCMSTKDWQKIYHALRR